jgi:hypothetical protein
MRWQHTPPPRLPAPSGEAETPSTLYHHIQVAYNIYSVKYTITHTHTHKAIIRSQWMKKVVI